MKERIDHGSGSRFRLNCTMKNSDDGFFITYTPFMNAHVIQVYIVYMSSKIDDSWASRFLHRSCRSLAPLSFLLCLDLCHPKLLQIRWYSLALSFKQIVFALISTIQLWNKWTWVWHEFYDRKVLGGQILIVSSLSGLYQTSEEISLRYFSIHPEHSTYFRFSSSLKCLQIKIEVNLQISRHFKLFNHLFKSLTDNTS
jgi:hypothetical protein